MPEYRPPPPLPSARVRGTIARIPFVSRGGVPRQIRVYVPPSASDAPRPVLYAHDGDIMLDALGLPSILDSLIGAGRMAPVYVAFIDPVDRHDDYEPGSRFRSEFTTEIIPMLERRYRVDSHRRSVIGLSRSTVGALDACANGSVRFERCALMAPAIPKRQFGAVLPPPGTSTRVFIETGTYDIPLVTDARALRRALEGRGLSVHFVESPEGHNRTAFRARLPALMEQLFPPEPPAVEKR
jgi:enterochelin esterase-like enzyme